MSTTPEEQRAKALAAAAARLVQQGVADNQAAFDHVIAEERGRQIAARLNAQRISPVPQPQPPKNGGGK